MSENLEAGRFDRFDPVARIKLTLAPDVELDVLQDLVARLYKNSGCAPCGRLSFTIDAIDPELVLPSAKELRQLPAVRDISIG
ncbi:MAG: hypothetical protein ACJ72N_20100 [Labedaea sp.]